VGEEKNKGARYRGGEKKFKKALLRITGKTGGGKRRVGKNNGKK